MKDVQINAVPNRFAWSNMRKWLYGMVGLMVLFPVLYLVSFNIVFKLNHTLALREPAYAFEPVMDRIAGPHPWFIFCSPRDDFKEEYFRGDEPVFRFYAPLAKRYVEEEKQFRRELDEFGKEEKRKMAKQSKSQKPH